MKNGDDEDAGLTAMLSQILDASSGPDNSRNRLRLPPIQTQTAARTADEPSASIASLLSSFRNTPFLGTISRGQLLLKSLLHRILI